MFLNVWLIIWPNQKIVLGMASGDGPSAGAKALLASRTNTLFSAPMLFGILASKHGAIGMDSGGFAPMSFSDMGFVIPLVIIILLEVNALMGKMGPIASVKGVIHMSLALTAVIFGLVHFL